MLEKIGRFARYKLNGFGRELGKSLFAISLAVLFGAILIMLTGESPLTAYGAMLKGAFGNATSIANTLSKAVPLIFTGLSVAISARCGMLNIGAEGQLHMGAMASALCGLLFFDSPSVIAVPACLLAGVLAGLLAGAIPGLLRARFKVSEVISAIMLNYVFRFFTSYLASGPFKSENGSVVQTETIAKSAELGKLVEGTQLTLALPIAVIVLVLLYLYIWKTPGGFKLRAVGLNKNAALCAGINADRYMVLAMALSGGVAGLAGVTEVMGKYGRFIEGFSPSFGFTGIAVAILGRNHPVGVVLTALLFAILDTGVLRMSRVTGVSANLVTVIQSMVVLLVAAPEMIRVLFPRRKQKGI